MRCRSKIRDYRAASTASKRSPNNSRFYIVEIREIMDIRERFRTPFDKGVL